MKLKVKIPKGWNIKKIRDIAKISSGATPLRSQRKYFADGTIPWIKTMDLNNSDIIVCDEKITKCAIKETNCSILPKGTILVAMYGGFRQIGRTGILGVEAATNQAISSLIVNEEEILSRYLLYWLNEHVFLWKRFAASSRKDPNITSNDVAVFLVLIPSLLEQQKIIKVLSIWDQTIAKVEKLIEAKKEYKKGFSQQLLTGKVRFRGFDEKTSKKKLKGFISELSIRNNGNHIDRVLSVTNRNGFVVQTEHFDKVVASTDISNYKIVRKGQFGYNPSRVNVGSIDLLENHEEGVLSPMYVIFKTVENKLLPKYLKQFIRSSNFLGQVKCMTQGSVRDSLSFGSLEQFKLFIPSLKEQEKIADFLSLIDKEINLLIKKRDALKEQKKGLMQQLLTGKIRVNV